MQVLDPEGKGWIEGETMRELLTTHGERFNEEDIEDFLNASSEPDTGIISYPDFCEILGIITVHYIECNYIQPPNYLCVLK